VQDLLESEEPEVLAIAIAALTGRRHAEVVAVGKFEATGHPYQLRFEGQQKKSDAEAFEIVSLVPGRDLLPVIERFRSLPGVQGLVGLDDDHPQVQAFNTRVNRRVQALFGATRLVPVLEGFKSVSIHRLRALYGAISIHFFCANNQHLHRFLQNHLGHVLTKEVGVGNSRATDHYFHYFLIKEDGTPITARGVKLMAHGSLVEAVTEVETVAVEKVEPVEAEMPVMTEVMEQDAPEESAPVEAPALSKKLKEGKLRIYGNDRDRWNHLLATRFPDRVNQAERMTALLEWAETNLPESLQATQAEPEPIAPSQAETIQATLDAVMERLAKLESERAIALAPKAQRTKAVRSQADDDPTAPKVGKAAGRANGILLAVQAWNRQHPDQSFAITLSLLKDEFGINFRAARDFLEERQNEIWELHQASGVENPRSHNRQNGRDLGELREFVKEFVRQG
jgi:Telomere resolvase